MIPDFQTIMLPLLDLLKNKQEYILGDIVDPLAKEFNLTEDERKELYSSKDA